MSGGLEVEKVTWSRSLMIPSKLMIRRSAPEMDMTRRAVDGSKKEKKMKAKQA